MRNRFAVVLLLSILRSQLCWASVPLLGAPNPVEPIVPSPLAANPQTQTAIPASLPQTPQLATAPEMAPKVSTGLYPNLNEIFGSQTLAQNEQRRLVQNNAYYEPIQGAPYQGVTALSPGTAVSTDLSFDPADPVCQSLSDVYVDLLFLMDATAPLVPLIEKAKVAALPQLTSIFQRFPKAQVATAAFTDKPVSPFGNADDYCLDILSPMTSDISNITGSLANIKIAHGNDPWQNPLEALFYTITNPISVGWRQADLGFKQAKIAVVMTNTYPHVAGEGLCDAVNQGNMHSSCTTEDYPIPADVASWMVKERIFPVFYVPQKAALPFDNMVKLAASRGALLAVPQLTEDIFSFVQANLDGIVCKALHASQGSLGGGAGLPGLAGGLAGGLLINGAANPMFRGLPNGTLNNREAPINKVNFYGQTGLLDRFPGGEPEITREIFRGTTGGDTNMALPNSDNFSQVNLPPGVKMWEVQELKNKGTTSIEIEAGELKQLCKQIPANVRYEDFPDQTLAKRCRQQEVYGILKKAGAIAALGIGTVGLAAGLHYLVNRFVKTTTTTTTTTTTSIPRFPDTPQNDQKIIPPVPVPVAPIVPNKDSKTGNQTPPKGGASQNGGSSKTGASSQTGASEDDKKKGMSGTSIGFITTGCVGGSALVGLAAWKLLQPKKTSKEYDFEDLNGSERADSREIQALVSDDAYYTEK